MDANQDKVTAEYYGDPLLVKLVGAVDIPAKRMIEAADTIGKAICKVIHADKLDTILIDEHGECVDRIIIHR